MIALLPERRRRVGAVLLGLAAASASLRGFFLPSLLLGPLFWPLLAALGLLLALPGERRIPALALLGAGLLLAGPAFDRLTAARPAVLGAEEPAAELSLVTHNVLYEGGSAEETAGVIGRVSADVLFLQEVSHAKAAAFGELLGQDYPHRVEELAHRADGKGHGMLVLSRFPLRAGPRFEGARDNVIAHCVEVLRPGRPLVACSVHLTSPSVAFEVPRLRFFPVLIANAAERRAQWDAITDAAEAMDSGHGHRILVGDFNSLPIEPLYRRMRRGWVDSWRELRWAPGPTYPAGQHGPPNAFVRPGSAFVRPDMVWTAPSVQPVRIDRLAAGGSDHRPLHAVVAY